MTFVPGLPVGPQKVDLVENGEGVANRKNAAGKPFVLRFSPRDMTWSDGAHFSISGKAATPGIQLMLPWERGERAGTQLYTAEVYFADGTIAGKPVNGFILFEHNYDEVPWAQGAFNDKRGALVAFSNQYADGSVESGYFYCGTTARAALVVDGTGKELTPADTMNVDVQIRDGGLVGADYNLSDGSEWRYERNPNASVDFATLTGQLAKEAPKSMLAFGRVRRKGELRKLVRWWSSSEAGTKPGEACSRA
jgi:hypothetical protein